MEFRCIECGFHIRGKKSLYVQYSPGNIRLMKCESCRAVADEYIECEVMILLIDLILHKPKAYRHLLYNKLDQQALFWKAGISFLVLDAYRLLILSGREEGVSDIWRSFPSLPLTYPKVSGHFAGHLSLKLFQDLSHSYDGLGIPSFCTAHH